jgi:glutathione-regulated potassium-efflux system ancillary protein KefG
MKLKGICIYFIFTVLFCGVAIAQTVTKNSENMSDKKDVLILVAHPDMKTSKANAALIGAVKDLPYVKIINLYETPFTPESYREAFGEAQSVVFQFPFYWASAPYLLKKWCDEIFGDIQDNPGVKGKKLLVVTTTGSEYETYRTGGRNMYTIDELLRPYQLLANHSGMVWQIPFALYGTMLPDVNARVEAGAPAYRDRISDLHK